MPRRFHVGQIVALSRTALSKPSLARIGTKRGEVTATFENGAVVVARFDSTEWKLSPGELLDAGKTGAEEGDAPELSAEQCLRDVCPTEDEEGIGLIQWVKGEYDREAEAFKGGEGTALHPELWRLFHVPNGGLRSKAQGVSFRLQGVSPGVPDYFLDVARHGFHGWRGELKRRVKSLSRVSGDQTEWIENLRAEGYSAKVFFGWEAMRDDLLKYLQ